MSMPSHFERYTTHHTSRRTDGWDYTQSAVYFVTICTQDRVCLFGTVEHGRMVVNALGRTVVEEWQRSEKIRERVHLDAFVVMPNHVHGIVVFADPDVPAPTCPRGYRAFGNSAPDLSNPPNFEKASTGGSTLGEKSNHRGEPDDQEKSKDANESDVDLPTGPAPRSLGFIHRRV